MPRYWIFNADYKRIAETDSLAEARFFAGLVSFYPGTSMERRVYEAVDMNTTRCIQAQPLLPLVMAEMLDKQ